MNLLFDPGQAVALAQKAHYVALAGHELARFGESEPELAGACGVEVCALEARTILSGGVPGRVAEASARAAQARRPVTVASTDLEVLSRLEHVVSLGAQRINMKQASMAAAEGAGPLATIGGLVGVATGIVGLWKAIF